MKDYVFNSIVAVFGTAISYLFGGWSLALEVLVFMVAADYITGVVAAAIEKKLSSAEGFRGIAKKVGVFILVAAAHKVDQMAGTEGVLMNATVYFFVANEGLSLLENLGRAGLPIPTVLRTALQQLRKKGEPENVGGQ